ncbi:LGFP repeat-containing protein [Streptomyces sp. NPDC097727]|uniref:LGFP repeat-containing protein n=1 Tax=Streptomyces sp. NPDC097727 TaxID=3366092 RepID=UPI0038287668
MKRPARSWTRKTSGAVAVAATAACLLLGIQAAPASAQPICGREVGGDILTKYADMGGTSSPLGCPVTGELANPDGVGKRRQFCEAASSSAVRVSSLTRIPAASRCALAVVESPPTGDMW